MDRQRIVLPGLRSAGPGEAGSGEAGSTAAGSGELTLTESWLAADDADRVERALREGTPWAQRAIKIFGREVMQPRLVAWVGDEGAHYTYSGVTLQPEPWSPVLAELRERLRDEVGVDFNSVLLNWYRTGEDSMGFHADDEPELGPDPVIASVSLGATRTFVLRPRVKSRRRERVTLPLTHGSLLVMSGEVQRHWHHGVPKEPRVMEGRINLTFRRIGHR